MIVDALVGEVAANANDLLEKFGLSLSTLDP